MDVHGPHHYRSDARAELGITTSHIRDLTDHVTEGERPPQAVIDIYDASLRHADRQIGRLLKTVGEDTTIVVTADHGEEFGRHNSFYAPSPYQSMAHVPLIIDGREFDTTRETDVISHVDLAATLVEIGGANPDELWDGTSLLSVTESDSPTFLGFENEDGVQAAVIDYPHKYMFEAPALNTEPTTESLFDISSDSHETDDQVDKESALLTSLRDSESNHVSDLQSSRLYAEHDIWRSDEDLSSKVNKRDNNEHEIDEQLEYLGYK